jgi:hypothetical protein
MAKTTIATERSTTELTNQTSPSFVRVTHRKRLAAKKMGKTVSVPVGLAWKRARMGFGLAVRGPSFPGTKKIATTKTTTATDLLTISWTQSVVTQEPQAAHANPMVPTNARASVSQEKETVAPMGAESGKPALERYFLAKRAKPQGHVPTGKTMTAMEKQMRRIAIASSGIA